MTFIALYIRWHYAKAPLRIAETLSDFLRFGMSFFAIPWHIRTLLSPWRMDLVAYRGGFLSGPYIQAAVLNAITRILGMIPRAGVIILGLLFELSVFAAGATLLIAWLLFPLAIPFFIIFGMRLLV